MIHVEAAGNDNSRYYYNSSTDVWRGSQERLNGPTLWGWCWRAKTLHERSGSIVQGHTKQKTRLNLYPIFDTDQEALGTFPPEPNTINSR